MKRNKENKKIKGFLVKKTNKGLPVVLTKDVLIERAQTMSQRCKEKEEVEAEKARVMRDFGERLKQLTGEVARLSQIVSSGEEHQQVDCEEQKLMSDKLMRIVRLDTGEVVETRPLLERELQYELELEEHKEA